MCENDIPNLPPTMFRRVDESADREFYAEPRFVAHIDQATIDALTDFYRTFLSSGSDVLDLMSSWISHLPVEVDYKRVSGLGMNREELQGNPRLNDFVVHDLNDEPNLPYSEHSFDRATLAVSIQYLIRPVEVMTSVHKVLRPGGRICVAMSHRLFPTKAIVAFQRLGPEERVQLVAQYLTMGGFTDVQFLDRSPPAADPLWLVVGAVRPDAT